MMSFVKAVIRPLNARATTSPTATTMTSPRIRKFLKPFMFSLRFAGLRPGRSPRSDALTRTLARGRAPVKLCGWWCAKRQSLRLLLLLLGGGASAGFGSGRTALLVPATAREDDELPGRAGHRDVAVDRSFDTAAERVRVDEDHQVELEPLRQLRGQRPHAGRRGMRGIADDAGDPFGMSGEPGIQDRVQIRRRPVFDRGSAAADGGADVR